MAQRILSPLRLPFRHIGFCAVHFKLVMRPAKMNFIVTNLHRFGDRKRLVVRAGEKLTAFAKPECAIRRVKAHGPLTLPP